ncbi:hypothetical protein AAFF_G00396280 [Aldrovandia affinis]|uniref:Uncharacterized protein n=1 Tax=Aldrovandia affinis TaxID=143900 RepID=A0AAD7SDI9_9TELE|nr:hypothetical protein AAFF_G00396280 [Aldrovandia affinis]
MEKWLEVSNVDTGAAKIKGDGVSKARSQEHRKSFNKAEECLGQDCCLCDVLFGPQHCCLLFDSLSVFSNDRTPAAVGNLNLTQVDKTKYPLLHRNERPAIVWTWTGLNA